MREIKCRGKGIEEYDKDQWYYGSYFKFDKVNYFFFDDGSNSQEIDEKLKNNITHKIIFELQGDLNMKNHIKLADVNPNTIGQYTGLKDKNGKEIYDGDILYFSYDIFTGNFDTKAGKGIVEFIYGSFYIKPFEIEDKKVDDIENEEWFLLYSVNEDTLEVIGNIYEKPDLLKKEGK